MRSPKWSFADTVLRGFVRLERVFRGRRQDRDVVLVLAYMPALGYAVHMTPVYEALARGGYRVVVATRGANLEVLRNSPFVHRLLETPDPMLNPLSSIRSLRRQLRRAGLRPCCVLTGPQDSRTRIGLLAALGCAGWRGGYAVHAGLYTSPLLYDRERSRLANNLRLVELLGCATGGLHPKLFPSAADLERARQMIPDGEPVLAIIPAASGGLPTEWLPERWAEVCRAAVKFGFEVVYVGAARDRSAIGTIQELAGGLGRSLAGETTVGELAAVLRRCRGAVAITTGAMHVARTTGVPMVVLAPAWEPQLEWLTPLEPQVRVLQGAARPRVSGYCMEEISVEMVLEKLETLLQPTPSSLVRG